MQVAAERERVRGGRREGSGRGGRDEAGKREDRGRESGRAREERGGQKRLARPFYFETNAQCSGRSVTQNSVLSVLQPLPDVAASLRKHTHTLNTSYLCFFSLCVFPNKSRLNSLWEKEALFGITFLAGV